MSKCFYAINVLFIVFLLMTSSVKAAGLTEKEVTASILKEINAYRTSYHLKPVKTSDETCDFAKIRAKEISTNFSHDGFNQRYKAGTLPYKTWRVVVENIAMTFDYKKVVDMWAHSPGHAKNMRADTTYACVGQYGDYFVYLGMRPR